MKPRKNIALIGNPNVGKTTIFNLLSRKNGKTGNWAGVTLQANRGSWDNIDLIDLPGCYSLHNFHHKNDATFQDIRKLLLSNKVDLFTQVITAHQIQRQLYLTLQLVELGLPIILLINHFKSNGHIAPTLEKLFQVPCLDINASQSQQQEALNFIQQTNINPTAISPSHKHLPQKIQSELKPFLSSNKLMEKFDQLESQPDVEIELAEARYQFINHQIFPAEKNISTLDRWLIHHPISWVIFAAVMLITFGLAVRFSQIIEPSVTLISETFFMEGAFHLLTNIQAPAWLSTLAIYGVGQGITTILSLMPIVFGMFFNLFYLEESGYLARVSVLMDRQLKQLGLPGSASISLFLGFGCNVSAILSTRHLKARQQRIISTIMIPFMSCSARLSIFAVFSTLLFPDYAAICITILYLTGILIAFLTALALAKILKLPPRASLSVDLVPLRWPKIRLLLRRSWNKTLGFAKNAGPMIILFCFILSLLNHIDIDGHMIRDSQQTSILIYFAKPFTQLFSPMGLTTDNWPAGVALFTGLLAKEVVIGTLSTLYAQAHAIHLDLSLAPFAPWDQCVTALLMLRENLILFISGQSINATIEPIIQHHLPEHFSHPIVAFSYMIFVLLYFPCISTFSVIRQEIGSRWAWFSVAWSLTIAYVTATLIYQTYHHPFILLIFATLIPAFIWNKWKKRHA